MNIEFLRNEIDVIDEKITILFEKRLEICSKVAKYKKENNLKILDQRRESEVLEKITNNKSDTFKKIITELYLKIFEVTKNYQKIVFEGDE